MIFIYLGSYQKNQNSYEVGLKAINSYLIRRFTLDEKSLDSYELKNILKNNISDSLLDKSSISESTSITSKSL